MPLQTVNLRVFLDGECHNEASRSGVRHFPAQSVQSLGKHAQAAPLPLVAEHPVPDAACKACRSTSSGYESWPAKNGRKPHEIIELRHMQHRDMV